MIYQLSLVLTIFIPSLVAASLGRKKWAFWLLLLAAFFIRLMMIGLDDYLHDWDERFHAVVAKNMMSHPFKPMLHLEALLPYKIEDWSNNYIWLHKQPLFLWQMALSMKIGGLNLIALRFPNVLMGTFMVFCVYQIAQIWSRNDHIAYLSALLVAASYYCLELCAGMFPLDHNDLMMGGYVTASFWAFCRYTAQKTWKWALLVGAFAGAAILVKWLTGLLIFGGWSLYLLSNLKERFQLQSYTKLLGAIGACCAVFMPWQLYISSVFPTESAVSYAYNVKHITEDLGHPGHAGTHFAFMTLAFSGGLFLVFMVFGSVFSFRNLEHRRLSLAMFGMFAVVYGFFSLVVATKMNGLTYPVCSIGMIWTAWGLWGVGQYLRPYVDKWPSFAQISLKTGVLFALTLYAFQASRMAGARKPDDVGRKAKIHNTQVYRELNEVVEPDEIVLNCKSFEDAELRFWQPNNAYSWCPTASQVDSLLRQGRRLAAFKDHNNQVLPDYIRQNERIKIIDRPIY